MTILRPLTAARHPNLAPPDRGRAVAYLSGQTHSSVAKALQIIGFCQEQIRSLPSDAAFRMNTGALEMAVKKDLAAGRRPFAVVATAGTTNTGSIAPLEEIADICRCFDLWINVAGYYVASLLFFGQGRRMHPAIELSYSIRGAVHN
mgnify:CR=1 FL=1